MSRAWARRFSFYDGLAGISFIILCFTVYTLTIPGEYSPWSEWTECSATCGRGLKTRNRSCTAPAPGMFGYDCIGPKAEKRICNPKACPRDGGYSEWLEFSSCDKSCGGGKRVRKRFCTNPLPLNGGSNCDKLGSAKEVDTCNTEVCPIDGGFSEWALYTQCDFGGKTCGYGSRYRTRTCDNPVPSNGGKPCVGPTKQTYICDYPCPTAKGERKAPAKPAEKKG